MRFRPLLMQLLIGMSIRRYLPAMGTAGLLRSIVNGNRRVPRPPPRMRLSTVCMVAAPWCGVGDSLGLTSYHTREASVQGVFAKSLAATRQLYPEGVTDRSPGSRSAPREE